MNEEILYIDDGELVYYINENEFVTCDEIPIPMLEGIKHLQQKVEQLDNIRKEAIKYVQEKADYPISYYHCLNDLLNILQGSDEK